MCISTKASPASPPARRSCCRAKRLAVESFGLGVIALEVVVLRLMQQRPVAGEITGAVEPVAAIGGLGRRSWPPRGLFR